jgi:hypothetical protein
MRMVHKAYLVDNLSPFYQTIVRHVLVDEYSVFVPTSGWHSKSIIEKNYKLVPLPKEIQHNDWGWDGWHVVNKQLEDWSWCYGLQGIEALPEFAFCRKHVDESGETWIGVG